MKALDTNVIVRFLVADDAHQAERVYRLFKKAEKNKERFFVSLPVILETLWVLDSVYEYTPSAIVEAMKGLLLLNVLEVESVPVVLEWLETAQTNKADLSDLLIGSIAKHKGCSSVLTFDKKAARNTLFEALV